ncbi:7 transmembrane receptor (rhodopsin family) domain-containing protein [Ditylenchus destructor]|uniref:7 transmembrane receptor (Rhodopsin family) domain-containing protein n=1 Tax=Ditylenchus destructor TaxID=166010 RepID=A0AAD4R7H5_9BILA|nr:7 transmembrane receptor (rhodopsin family) domain-containing protein [Ditylenchus destructor]
MVHASPEDTLRALNNTSDPQAAVARQLRNIGPLSHEIWTTPPSWQEIRLINITDAEIVPYKSTVQSETCTFQQWTQLPNQPGVFRIFTIISVLTILVMLVVLGNALVIAAVILRRRLRSATGLLILSLAVADLMVGLVILPFSIANEVLNSYWIFGDAWCTAWLTMDIWMCTASIYNLVAISIDRYIAIIKPLNYPMLITKFRARCIVAAVWIGSFVICSPSFLLASTERKSSSSDGTMSPDDCKCTPSNSGMAYIVFSASSSFYIPMIIVIFVYARIYVAACAATKSVYSGMMQVTATANKNPKNILMQNPAALSRAENLPILRVHRGSTCKIPPNGDHPSFIKSQNAIHPGITPIPISINSSMPTVYAQMNGSNNSLQYIKRNSRFPRRHSEEIKDKAGIAVSNAINATNRERLRSPTRRSVGNIHNTIHESPTAILNESTFLGNELSVPLIPTPVILNQKSGLLNSVSEQEKMRWFYGSNASAEHTRRSSAGREENTTLPNGVENYILGEFSEDAHPETAYEETRAFDTSQESQNHTTPENSLDPVSQKDENGTVIKKDEGSNGTPIGQLLHPDSAKKPAKKRNYGAKIVSRIMRRGPRKKAGCAYEKRLSLEIKAAKTVAIVTGCFIFCWLGFSILYGLSFTYQSNEIVWSIVFWLGYLNSALNPVIYTVFNREFRTCFKRLLTCNHMIFGNRGNNQNHMYNSYNSQLRIGKPTAYSSVSAPQYYNTRSSPPGGNSEDS